MAFRALLLCVCVAAAAAQQPEPGEIRGRVVDSRGNEPLARVQVQLTGTTYRTITETDGTFVIAKLPPGDYVMQMATVGYHMLRQNVTLAAGESKTFEVVLTPSSYRRTDSVEVKAEPFDLARSESASALTLEGNEEKNLASVLADDPLRAVQSLPGVTANNDFSSEFSVRGAGFDRIGLFLDDVLLHSPFHMVEGQVDNGSLTIFNGDMLDELTLFQGAWPVRYSDRTAGMLSVLTRDGNRDEVQFRISASASNAGVMVEGPLDKKHRASWMLAFRKSYLQYILNRVNFGTDDPSLAFGFTDGQAKLTYDLTPKHTVTLSFIDGFSSLDRTASINKLGLNSALTSGYSFTVVNLGSRYTPAQGVLLTNRLAWTRERGSVENKNNSTLGRDDFGEWTWVTNATWIWAKSQNLDFGGTFRRSREDGYSWRYENVTTLSRPLDLFRGTGQRSGAYVQQGLGFLNGRIRVTGGARWDKHSTSVVDTVSPYASIAFQPWQATRLQFDWGQYSQFPSLSQFYSIFGKTSLLPQRATHYEVALDQRLDERTRVRMSVYDRQDRDLLARPLFDARMLLDGRLFAPLTNAPIVNSQRGYSRGMQIMVQRRTANGFTGWVSYSYGVAKLHDGVVNNWFHSDYDQRHTVSVFGSYRLKPTVNLSVKYAYGTGFPIPGFFSRNGANYFLAKDRNQLHVQDYSRADARINKAFIRDKWKLTLFAEVVNLTNRTNRDFDTYNGYNTRTGQANLSFYTMFPILPSAGITIER